MTASNKKISKKLKEAALLQKALKKDRENSSIDFYKVAIGDYTENQRLKMRQYQDAMNEMKEESEDTTSK